MYLVTGATGNVGREVVSQLLRAGERVRVFTREPGKAAHWGDRVEVATGEFARPHTVAPAIAEVEGVFLMNPVETIKDSAADAQSFIQVIAMAKAQGKPRVVFLSTLLAGDPESQIGRLHKVKEDAIRESGLPGKFLRAGGFMSNTLQWIGTIKAEGVVYNPMGSGRVAPIAPEDIGAVAVKALMDSRLAGATFEITGGELLSVPEQVSILAGILHKPIRCIDVPTETTVEGLIRAGVSAPAAAAVAQTFEAIRDGRAASLTDTVKSVTGRPPKTFAAWAREHASRFT